MKQKLSVILLIALFSVSAAMAGHHGLRPPRVPEPPMAPNAPYGFCGPEMGRHFLGAGKLLHLADKLELTDKQITEIKEKMESNGLDCIDRQAELKKAKLKLRHLKMNDASDNEILLAIEKVGKLQTEMKKQRFVHCSEMKSILTDVQREKLKELRKEFRGNCKPEGKGFRGHGIGYYFEEQDDLDDYGLEPPSPSDEWEY